MVRVEAHFANVMDFNLFCPKACSPIDVTVEGMAIELRFAAKKARSPITVTPSGILMDESVEL